MKGRKSSTKVKNEQRQGRRCVMSVQESRVHKFFVKLNLASQKKKKTCQRKIITRIWQN